MYGSGLGVRKGPGRGLVPSWRSSGGGPKSSVGAPSAGIYPSGSPGGLPPPGGAGRVGKCTLKRCERNGAATHPGGRRWRIGVRCGVWYRRVWYERLKSRRYHGLDNPSFVDPPGIQNRPRNIAESTQSRNRVDPGDPSGALGGGSLGRSQGPPRDVGFLRIARPLGPPKEPPAPP